MKHPILRTFASAMIALAAAPAFASDEAALLDEARGVASSIPPKLLAVLKAEIEKGGPEGAMVVCREKAPEMAKAASEKTGWKIRRVSLKNRNPKAVPDAWEQAALEDFDRRAAAGESPAKLEKAELVTEGDSKSYRYMKALPTQPLCLECHGSSADISPAVKAKLAELYPDDKAVGYSVGQIRGAMTIRKPL
ncbi:MAG: DUF3365 domain-containing protein [Zoogloeaceae bacterium]|nr:DUF3365 domain-containing protein [Zoogloeaceae bacterium]MCP5239362.1 DUF3365 domain-containing protein [Zoogloeaceae bacterium]MCP5254870.1 DUF3365 domain-containing protein [Zoogloeaceae bacterium]MCP5295579.1 DUF3365 domain-containing protein [Zoogloeaceae bacterium]